MACTLTVTDVSVDVRREHVIGTVLFDAVDNYAAGGMALSLKDIQIKSTKVKAVILQGAAPYMYKYVRSSGKILIVDLSTNLELANGAVPAAVRNDVIDFYGVFDKFR